MSIEFSKGAGPRDSWQAWADQDSAAGESSEGFFRSKHWLLPYVRLWPDSDFYGFARNPGAVIGCRRMHSRLGIPYTALGLNLNLRPEFEDITLEENGFLNRDQDDFAGPLEALLEQLLTQTDWQELRIDGLTHAQALESMHMAKTRHLIGHTYHESTTYWVDLDQVRSQCAGDYLKHLSANTRQQLRKSRRMAEAALGPVKLDHPVSLEQAQEWLEELGKLHGERWNPEGLAKGFRNPTFVRFYRDQTTRAWHAGQLWLTRLRAGETPLAYLYNFAYQRRLCFMMSGINYHGTDAFRPGMLAHWLGVEDCLSKDIGRYDFLAGRHRYKESLSSATSEIYSIVLRRSHLHFRLEDAIRRAKRRILRQHSPI